MKGFSKSLFIAEPGLVTGLFLALVLVRRGIIAPFGVYFLLILLAVPVLFLLSWRAGRFLVSISLGRPSTQATRPAVFAYLIFNLFIFYVYTVRVAPTAAPTHFAVKTSAFTISCLFLYFSLLFFRRAYRGNAFLLHTLLLAGIAILAQRFMIDLVQSGYDFSLRPLHETFSPSRPFHELILAKVAWLGILWIALSLTALAGIAGKRLRGGKRRFVTILLESLVLIVIFGAVIAVTSRGKEDIDSVLRSLPAADPMTLPVSGTGSFTAKKIEIGAESRDALFLPSPDSVSFDVEAPADAELVIGVGIMTNAWKRNTDGTWFEVRVSDAHGTQEKLAEAFLDPRLREEDRSWRDLSLDLSRWAGTRVKVEAITRGSPPGDRQDASFDYAVISYPYFRRNRVSEHPNIVLLLVDTLRSDRLGCYGYHRSTPAIDSLAGDGVLFGKTISTAPWTNPSVLSIHSSLYPSDVWNPMKYDLAITQSVPDRTTMLAEAMRTVGYATAAITDHPGISDDTGYLQGFERIVKFFKMHSDRSPWGVTTMEDAERMEEVTSRILRSFGKGPFFFYVHLIYPHYPYAPPDAYRERIARERLRQPLPLDPARRETLSSLYDGEVMLTDDYVRFLTEEIEALGLDVNTVVVITSDHGEGFWEHGLCEHGNSLFNELLSVPLIIWGPGASIRPARIENKVSLIDLAPTLLDLAGAQAGPQLRGRSLAPLLHGMPASSLPQERCFSESQYAGDIRARSVQDESMKLIYDGESHHMTSFDLVRDPGEQEGTVVQDGDASGTLRKALLAHIASAEEGVVVWCEGVSGVEIEAEASAGFAHTELFGYPSEGSAESAGGRLRVRADPNTVWKALILDLNDPGDRALISFSSIPPSDRLPAIRIGPDRKEASEEGNTLQVSMHDPVFKWDLLSMPRPGSSPLEGILLWTTSKSHTEKAALSAETLEMLRAMGYVQ